MSQGEARLFSFKIINIHGDARFNVEILDREDGNAQAAWKQAGNPEPPNKAQLENIKAMSMAVKEEQVLSSTAGVLYIEKTLQPWDVMLIDEVPH
jgi:xylan 1,4-beta-xylosidase